MKIGLLFAKILVDVLRNRKKLSIKNVKKLNDGNESDLKKIVLGPPSRTHVFL